MHIASDRRASEICGQQLLGRESILRRQPAELSRRHTGNPPSYAVVVAEFLLFSLEECNECPADIAEADDAEVVGPDVTVSRLKWRCVLL
jgi:hypothetical protein